MQRAASLHNSRGGNGLIVFLWLHQLVFSESCSHFYCLCQRLCLTTWLLIISFGRCKNQHLKVARFHPVWSLLSRSIPLREEAPEASLGKVEKFDNKKKSKKLRHRIGDATCTLGHRWYPGAFWPRGRVGERQTGHWGGSATTISQEKSLNRHISSSFHLYLSHFHIFHTHFPRFWLWSCSHATQRHSRPLWHPVNYVGYAGVWARSLGFFKFEGQEMELDLRRKPPCYCKHRRWNNSNKQDNPIFVWLNWQSNICLTILYFIFWFKLICVADVFLPYFELTPHRAPVSGCCSGADWPCCAKAARDDWKLGRSRV